jgi:hypothetical protein
LIGTAEGAQLQAYIDNVGGLPIMFKEGTDGYNQFNYPPHRVAAREKFLEELREEK